MFSAQQLLPASKANEISKPPRHSITGRLSFGNVGPWARRLRCQALGFNCRPIRKLTLGIRRM